MSRDPRYIPPGGALVEVTYRTQQGRFLLRPSRELNEIVGGVLGRAVKLTPIELCGFVAMSNHLHLLAWVENARQLARFMNHLGSNLAREVCKLHGWADHLWSGRYHAAVVSDEPEKQVARLEYLLAQGVKEHLVGRPEQWPGVHCARALKTGAPLTGWWFDRTREGPERRRARLHRKPYHRYACAEHHRVELQPIPCWRHLPPEVVRERVAELIEAVVAKAAADRRQLGIRYAGVRAVEECHPHARPEDFQKRPAPRFHAASREVRKAMEAAFREFVAAYRAASEKLRAGDPTAVFPPGCFPPALPFVGEVSVRGP